MARRKPKINLPHGYITLGRHVYLGRCNKRTRANARAAGLSIVTVKFFRKLHSSMMAIQRISCEGLWYDTVKY